MQYDFLVKLILDPTTDFQIVYNLSVITHDFGGQLAHLI